MTRRLWNFLSLASGVWKPIRVGGWMTDTWLRPAPPRWARAVPVPVVSRHFFRLPASTSASIPSSLSRGSSRPLATTAAIFVVLWMSASGSASRSTRSASLPGSTVPRSFSRPRNRAGSRVAAWRASRGVKPPSATSRANSSCGLKPGKTNGLLVAVRAEPGEDERVARVGPGQEGHAGAVHRPHQPGRPAIPALQRGGRLRRRLLRPERAEDGGHVLDARVGGELGVVEAGHGAQDGQGGDLPGAIADEAGVEGAGPLVAEAVRGPGVNASCQLQHLP